MASTLRATLDQFAGRHPDLDGALERNYEAVAGLIDEPDSLSLELRLLIGAYFTHEYEIEAAALSDPSIVAAPDQSGLGPAEQRFIVSLRAIGEGHLSSIGSRTGVIDSHAHIAIDEPSRHATTGRRRDPLHDASRRCVSLVRISEASLHRPIRSGRAQCVVIGLRGSTATALRG